MQNHLHFLSQLLEVQSDSRAEQLEAEIDYLLHHNQEKLLWILYRLDVSETKLKESLSETTETEAKTITQLLLNRCKKIMETRKKFGASDESPDWSFDV